MFRGYVDNSGDIVPNQMHEAIKFDLPCEYVNGITFSMVNKNVDFVALRKQTNVLD